MSHHSGKLDGRFCCKYLEEEAGRALDPFSPPPAATATTGTAVDAPSEFTFQLTLRDCGVTDHSCLTLCMSYALIGDHNLSTHLRYLAAAQLLCLPGTTEDESVRHLVLREVKAAITLGHGMGQPVVAALAHGLGIKIYYTMRMNSMHIPWQCEEPPQEHGDTEERAMSAPTDVPPRNAAFIYHKGSYHYLLGIPPGGQPLWAGTPHASLDAAQARIRELTEALLARSKASTSSDLAWVREAVAKIDVAWHRHQQTLLGLHPGRPIHSPSTSDSDDVIALSPVVSTPGSTSSGVGEKDAVKTRRPNGEPCPAKKKRTSEYCAFDTLLKNDKKLPIRLVDTSEEARAVYALTQRWRCKVCGELLLGTKDRLLNHYQAYHKVDTKQLTLEASVPVGSNEDRDKLVMCLVSLGLSYHTIRKLEAVRCLFQTSSPSRPFRRFLVPMEPWTTLC